MIEETQDKMGDPHSQLAADKPTRRPNWLLFGTKVLVSAALLVWIVSRANLSEIVVALSHANLMWLLLAAVSPAVGVAITSTRWGGLLRAQGVEVPIATLAKSCVVAGFVQLFLPSTIGGDAVRGHDSWKAGVSKSGAVAALIVDRILGLLTLVMFAAVALCFPQELTLQHPILFGLVGIIGTALAVATWFIFRPPRLAVRLASHVVAYFPASVRQLVERFAGAVKAYWGKNRALTRALMLSVLLQVNVVTFYWLLGRAMGFEIPYHRFFLIVPIAVLVMLTPVSINAIGVREGIFVFLLASCGVDAAQAIAFAWLEQGLFLLYGVIGGFVYVLRTQQRSSTLVNAGAE